MVSPALFRGLRTVRGYCDVRVCPGRPRVARSVRGVQPADNIIVYFGSTIDTYQGGMNMLTQVTIPTLVAETNTAELSNKLQQIRRLRVDRVQPGSRHLQSALETAKRKPGAPTADVSYIFIGLLPS